MENGDLQHGGIVKIQVMDDRGLEAAIGVGDGRVCLIELADGDVEWENQVTFRELSDSIRLWRVPDVTGDGFPDIFVSKGYVKESAETVINADGVETVTMPLRTVAVVNGADGSAVWSGQMYTAGCAFTTVDDQPVVIELHPRLGIRTVNLWDGHIETCVAIPSFVDKAAKLNLMSDGSYLLISEDGSLAAVSPAGEALWAYSRLSSAEVQTGKFNSDAVPDLLVLGEVSPEAGVRQLSVLDGVTKKEMWRYDVARIDSSAVLRGVHVIDDLTGDDIEDIVGWVGRTVVRVDGADGSVASFEFKETIVSLEPFYVSGSGAMLVCSAQGLTILDNEGVKLWESLYRDWNCTDFGAVEVLNDLNQDGVSDLALCFADCMLIAVSHGVDPLGFAALRSVNAETGKMLSLKELTNDIDGDGVQEVACFEYDAGASVADGMLFVLSPTNGQIWHRWDMPATVDVACADLNGDDFQDSLVHRQIGFSEMSAGSYYGEVYEQTLLEVYSGKDGKVLWSYSFDEDRWDAGGAKMPATPAGDVSGDGIEDLAVSSIVVLGGSIGTATDSDGETETRFLHETHVSVYDIANGTLLREIVLPQAQKDSQVISDEGHSRYFEPVSGPGDALRLAGDLDGDAQQELAVLASYLPTGGHCLALIDLEDEQLLGFSAVLSTLDFFETSEPYTVGFSAEGSVCLANFSSELKVTSPAEGDVVGNRVRISWEGNAASSSISLFVDGYESARTSGNEVVLPVTAGEHEVVVRSVDEFGTVTYAVVHFRAEGAPSALILACLSAIALVAAYFAVRWARVARNVTLGRGHS